MEDIWMNACRNLEISDDIARPWYERIRKKMVQGSGRFYHNWDELLLRKEDYLRDVSSNVLFAVFFQYYEFDGKRNCVVKNCEAFDEFCTEAGIKDTAMAKAVKKLLGDESIEPLPGTEAEANLLQDLDLLVLGSPPEEYKRYKELLRKEYSYLDDESYKQMRLKVTECSPSTSREALKTNSNIASPKKPKSPAKAFVKFKDDKYKYHPKRYITQASGRSIHFGYSPSQIVSRKILRTIKKKQNPNTSRTQIGTRNRASRAISVCDLTKTAKSKPVPKSTNNEDNDDDDCVIIGSPPPEVILIDDETAAAPSNLESSLSDANISNISDRNQLLKTYQPIGSASTLRYDYYKTLHSTPKLIVNGSTSYPITPRYERTMPMIREKSPDIPPESESPLEPILTSNIIRERFRSRKRRSSNEDDSVIFVSEETGKKPPAPVLTADFISLSTPTEKYPVSTKTQEPQKKRQRNPGNELFSSKEQIQLRHYNENAYNPNTQTPETATKKRMVIVDGSNVAYNHALNKEFSVKGLKICLDYFEKLGHEVKAVVPQFRLQKLKSSDPTALEKLHEEGKIVFTPCKNLPGKSSSSYDDRFILQLAAELDAAIVSNDNYRDLINENPAFKKIIENRVIGFSWCNDIFILPKDPYGKWGPPLSTILNRS